MFDRNTPVRMIMTENVLSVSPDTVMSEVVSAFKANPVHHIPVVQDGKVLDSIPALRAMADNTCPSPRCEVKA